LLAQALEAVSGPALVLDAELRVVALTSGVAELLGDTLRIGVSAPKVLCAGSEARPLAQALANGQPGRTTIDWSRDGRTLRLEVRAAPLGQPPEGYVVTVHAPQPSPTRETNFGIVTEDRAMLQLLRDVQKVARANAPVLVRGETGAGKELIARAIHESSDRSGGPFRALNCAALPPALLESELFGHARGAFTGAMRDAPGHFRLADGGTLFLDEVAELPLELQPKLLRVLQERTVVPVGGAAPIAVDVRVVSATHQPLRQAVQAGRFRADLMYRLRVVPLYLPPLRERLGDIPLLIEHFIARRNALGGRRVETVTPGAMARLMGHDWPGNVRELENVVEHAFVMGEGPHLSEADLPRELLGEPETARATTPPQALSVPPAASVADPEARRLLRALERAGGSRERAARALGLSRTTLWRRLRALGLAQ
jgi:transcriptional regulator with PAS, ATPase and Fis domain